MTHRLFLSALAMASLYGCQSPSTAPAAGGSSSTSSATPSPAASPVNDKQVTATLEPRSGSKMAGTATFVERDGKVTLSVHVENAPPGPHGIHLHEKGDCSSPDAKSAGGHWNPTNEPHGKMGDTAKAHSGDMGNLEVGPDGHGHLEFTSDRWTLDGDDKTSVRGKAVVIHAKADDLKTQPTGDSGDRIGCGVVPR